MLMMLIEFALERTMDRDPRTQERNNLKLALATFALQIDAFEARVKGGPLATIRREVPVQPDIGFAIKVVTAMRNPAAKVLRCRANDS
jgi:hypothetical protein